MKQFRHPVTACEISGKRDMTDEDRAFLSNHLTMPSDVRLTFDYSGDAATRKCGSICIGNSHMHFFEFQHSLNDDTSPFRKRERSREV